METVELSRPNKAAPWALAAMVGSIPAILVLEIPSNYLEGLIEPLRFSLFALAGAVGVLLTVVAGTLRTSVTLLVADPPIVETTRSCFGPFVWKTQKTLDGAVWARVVYADDSLLAIEVGTNGHQTTTVMCVPYSDENIPVAEKICEKVASALRLENKGYLRYA